MKNYQQHSFVRSVILIALAVFIFGAFGMKLLQIQIVDAAYYQEMVQGVSIGTQPIKAVRGEIVDRNGIPLIQNKMSYDVILDKAFLPTGETNETLVRLMGVFEETGNKWTDNLPLSSEAPFTFLKGKEEDLEVLRKEKGMNVTATPGDMMYWLVDEYKLEDHSPEVARKIAGVRYEMERRDFSLQTPYTFAKDIDNTLVIQIKERSFQLEGVNVETNAVRMYPDDTIAPHILGLVGPLYKEDYEKLEAEDKIFQKNTEPYDTWGYTMDDTIGKSGVEKAFEEYLRGQNGLKQIQMDAEGQVIEVTESISPIPGKRVVLTIDSVMQKNLQDYLEAQINYLAIHEPSGRGGDAHSGAAVVVNVQTGEVLAAATYPSYSLQDYQENYGEVLERKGKPLINRAIVGQYTPGSIYKPVVALAGVNDGVITRETTFFCNHIYTYFAPEYMPQCLGSHGNIGVYNALGWSCNIFFYETGRIAGIESIDAMAKQLGLGEPTGIEIEEGIGQRSNPGVKEARGGGEWYGADTIQTAIGQFDSRFSPLQMANYAATIANRGKRMELTLVKEITSYSGEETLEKQSPKVAHEMKNVSELSFDVTIEGMIHSTTGSSGGTFEGYPISVAAKTGTPQVTEDIVNSTYIAYAPVENPEIAICVVIEEGWQGYTGAPVAKAIFDDYFGVDDHISAVDSGPQQLRLERLAKEEPKKEKETSSFSMVEIPQENSLGEIPLEETPSLPQEIEEELPSTQGEETSPVSRKKEADKP